MKKNIKIFLISLLAFLIIYNVPTFNMNATSTRESISNPSNSGLMDILWTNDGDWYPDNFLSRFRGLETSLDETFYQWWYWMAKDIETNSYFAMCYYYIRAPDNPEVEGTYMLFSAVTELGKVMIWYKYSLDEFNFLGNDFEVEIGPNSEFIQRPITNDLYHIDGLMNEPEAIWTSEISYPGLNQSSVFTWNLDVERIVGCCTQIDYIDDPLMADGIKWNTASFDSIVSGSVEMGGNVFVFDGESTDHGYMDTNFDTTFLAKAPEGEPEDKYRWSWASATKYDLDDPTNDIAIIAGYGLSDNMFGIDIIDPLGIFAAAYNVLDHNIVWKSIDTRENGIDVNLIEKCSWGSSSDTKIEVSVDAWDYFIFQDSYGEARIPHYQRYILEGEYVSIHMTFYVTADEINRLPSPYTEYTWSNFEALGCTAFVQIFEKTYKWWDIFHLNNINILVEEFYDYNAGLEYGYAVDMIEI